MFDVRVSRKDQKRPLAEKMRREGGDPKHSDSPTVRLFHTAALNHSQITRDTSLVAVEPTTAISKRVENASCHLPIVERDGAVLKDLVGLVSLS